MKSRYPFTPFPNGWFFIARTDELPAGGVLPLHRFGQELVLFRSESGKAQMLDAYCPHLGAHLGHGGCVKGEEILCPFHAWRFNGAGQCTGIPYSDKVPRQAKLRSWEVRENCGLIMAWHHSEGLPPNTEAPFPTFLEGAWSPGGWRQWKVRTHVQEMLENAVDSAHFVPIHKALIPATSEVSLTEQGLLRVVVNSALDFDGSGDPSRLVPSRSEITVQNLGINFVYNQAGPLEVFILAVHTPIDGEFVDMGVRVHVKRQASEEMTAGFEAQTAQHVGYNVEQDIRIWENKVWRSPPVLCAGDGAFGEARRWAKQFYSAPTAQERQDKEDAA